MTKLWLVVDVETLPIAFPISVVADVQTQDTSTESSTFLRELLAHHKPLQTILIGSCVACGL